MRTQPVAAPRWLRDAEEIARYGSLAGVSSREDLTLLLAAMC